MNFIVKKTVELSEDEQNRILAIFNTVFKIIRTKDHFRNQFLKTVLGYSYHSLLYDGNLIVGCYSYIPSYYKINEIKYLSALGLDLMICEEYRGKGYLKSMFSVCLDYMRNDGIIFIITFPNDISYPGFIKSKLFHDFGNLLIYALPYRIGGILSAFKILNWLSIFLVNAFIFFVSLFANRKIYNFFIEKEAETYNKTRYSNQENEYHIEQSKGDGFVYRIMDYEGVKAAFLIDVFEKSPRNFCIAIKYIIKNHHKEFDILLYVGKLPFKFHGLMKVPQYFSPKNFHFLGQLLKGDKINSDLFFTLNSWDINLSNYDLL